MVFWSWFLLVLLVGLGLANMVRGVLAIVVAPVLAQAASVPFPMLGLVYVVWGILFLVCCYVVFRRPGRARQTVRGFAVGYQLTVWIIHIAGDASSYARQLWVRDLVVSLLFLLVVFVLTGLSDRRTRLRRR
jgi:hypothetical protein